MIPATILTLSGAAPLFWMIVGHGLADYPLQGDWLSKAKNHNLDLVPGERIWPLALTLHAAIHAAALLLVTGSGLLAVFEFTAHIVIDYGKCDGWFGYNTDQGLHIVCKFVWLALLMWGIS